MKKIWEKYKEHFIIILIVVSTGAIFIFIIKPLLVRIDFQYNSIQEQMANQQGREKKMENLPKLREQSGIIIEQEEKMKALLSREDMIVLLERVEKIAEETNNKIIIDAKEEDAKNVGKAQKTEEKKDDGSSIKLPSEDYVMFNFLISGDFNNLVNFIERLENMEYWSDIVSLKISQGKSNLSSPTSGRSLQTNPFAILSGEGDKENPVEMKKELDSSLEIVFYLKK